MLPLLRLDPVFHARVWGGQRLKPASPPIGEAWIVHEDDGIVGRDQTLGQLAKKEPLALLGSVCVARTGDRFPLLIKLLDCADWLSIQVHPDDVLAEELEGRGQFGKTEAWYFLHAEPGAEAISGVSAGTTEAELTDAIRSGQVKPISHFEPIASGDAILMPARTMHALGPGLFLYEVQQTSDTTYRVWDWDRPLTGGRELHQEKSVRVTDPNGMAEKIEAKPFAYGLHRILKSAYFQLDRYDCAVDPLFADTRGESVYMVTCIDGAVSVTTDHGQATLGPFETVLVPAETGPFHLTAAKTGQALVSHVPAG